MNTACEGIGASLWWPNKDQWRDEVENMQISVAIPNGLVDVSNGKFAGKTDLGDGYTRWDWRVHYPINNYDVSLNIGSYQHFAGRLGNLPLDFYALPEDLDKAKKQFAQAKGMLEAFQHYFGEYPFRKDGYKLIEVPYSGMEHQSAVTYGNHFANGYLERDWTGVGISPRFDFIIVHESAHEWFGNSITAADMSDMWIHEGWATYLECLYVEYMWGREDALKYINGYKSKVRNAQPIIAPLREPPDIFDRIADANSTHCDPLGRNRHLRWVIPEAFLGEMESDFFHQSNKQLEVVNGTCGCTLIVASADVQDEAAVFAEDALNLLCKRQKPLNIVVFMLIAVCFFEVQGVGW